jgi:hypothetical protein
MNDQQGPARPVTRASRTRCCGLFGALVLVLALLAPLAVHAADEQEWPREMQTPKGTVTMYQPQIDSYDGVHMTARAAVSVAGAAGQTQPVFGAVWLDGRTETDRDARTVEIVDITIPNVRFPDANDAQAEQLAAFVQAEMATWELIYPLDQFVAELDDGTESLSTPDLNHEPPVIIYRQKPALLVTIDGEPVVQKMNEAGAANLERVVNTPFLIVRETGAAQFYLSTGDRWYAAAGVTGPWTPTTAVSASITSAFASGDEEPAATGPAPEIVVATVPTELVVSDGPPKWAAVEGMELLFMDNTDSNVFLDIKSQYYYIVLAGRWYRAAAVQGALAWMHVPNDELPAGFGHIPEDSVNGDVLAHVSGTDAAREAALDNAIPQTAAVTRGAHELNVEYDGKPQFEPVAAVQDLDYAVNTPDSVFRINGQYYICEDGVWYIGVTAEGPWQVAATVPPNIYEIPPSSPHYNVTYVRVYDVTPEVVYVGYTPGYVGSYYYHGAVVWGSGWYYRPWWGTYYYPRPVTYGYRVHYYPYGGWSYGVAFYHGPYRSGVVWGGRYGWFGVAGYHPRPALYVGYGYRKTNININRGDININRPGIGGAGRPVNLPARGNIYARNQNRDRVVTRPRTGDRKRPTAALERRNNILTDPNGNVYRRGENGNWERRKDGQWQPAKNLDRSTRVPRQGGQGPARQPAEKIAARPTQRPAEKLAPRPAQRPAQRPVQQPARTNRSIDRSRPKSAAVRPQLERDYSARMRGAQRSNNSRRSRSGMSARGGGAVRSRR